MKSGKEYKFQIPLENKGEGDYIAEVASVSTNSIQVVHRQIPIQPQDTQNLLFKATFKKIGIIKETIELNGGLKIMVRGVCID